MSPSPINLIKREVSSPLVQAFLQFFQEEIDAAHQKMETASEPRDLYQLQGRIIQLREMEKKLKEHRQVKFKQQHGHYH